jgi:hypothetical protein
MKRKPSPQPECLPRPRPGQSRPTRCGFELDAVLDADPLYQQVCIKPDRLEGEAIAGEVLLRVLLVKHLYV